MKTGRPEARPTAPSYGCCLDNQTSDGTAADAELAVGECGSPHQRHAGGGLSRVHAQRAIFLGFWWIRYEIRRLNEGKALYVTNLHSSGTEQSQGTRDRHDVTVINLHHRRKKSLRGLKKCEKRASELTSLKPNPRSQNKVLPT